MKIVLSMRYIERDGKRVLQQRVGELDLVLEKTPIATRVEPGRVFYREPELQLQLDGDPVWEDVPLDLT